MRKEPKEACGSCGGSGEVTTMEYVYPGEPHMAPVGIAPCRCRWDDDDEPEDDWDDDDRDDEL